MREASWRMAFCIFLSLLYLPGSNEVNPDKMVTVIERRLYLCTAFDKLQLHKHIYYLYTKARLKCPQSIVLDFRFYVIRNWFKQYISPTHPCQRRKVQLLDQ